MHDEDGLCVTINKAGKYALVLNGTQSELRFIPMSVDGAVGICFVPVSGTTTLKLYASKAPICLRFRKGDLGGAALKRYSIFAEANIAQRRMFSEVWQFPPLPGLKLKLVAMKSETRSSELAGQLRSARDNEWGPFTAFAADNPEVINGWRERAVEKRSLTLGDCDPSVVVALHLNNALSWPDFERHLELFPVPFKLCVSSPGALPVDVAARIEARFPGSCVVEAGRQGGAIAGFLELLYQGEFDGDVIICRLNDGASVEASDANSRLWQMRASLIAMLSSTSRIEGGVAMFRASPDFGIVGPALMRRAFKLAIPGESDSIEGLTLRDVLARMGLSALTRSLEYFVGGSFWLRSRALSAMRNLNLSDVDFQIAEAPEALASAIEMVFCESVCNSGFQVAEFSSSNRMPQEHHGRDVTAAAWRDIKSPGDVAGCQVCLFVSYVPNGRITEATLHYLQQLKSAGFYIHVLVAVDDPLVEIEMPGADFADALSMRANEGYDFALWAAALKRHPGLLNAEALLFANDSVFGPVRPLTESLARIRKLDADIVAMTENYEHQHHFQSYFLYFKSGAVKSQAFRRFWANVRSQPNKLNLIRAYEVSMLAKLEAAGLRGAVLFSGDQSRPNYRRNPSIREWRDLLRSGFPFIKIELLRDNPTGEDLSDWRNLVAAHGYDIRIIERFFAERCPTAVALQFRD